MSSEQFCSSCGGRVFPDDRFCAHCGAAQEVAPGPEGQSGPSPWDPVLEKLRAATEGRYEIGRVLGTGGMAAVYLAREVRLNRPVAIKVMSPGLMMQPGMIERFRHEAITVAGLSHPNIVTIYTVDETDDLHYFVMKYIPGPSLEDVIRRDGPLPRTVVKVWLTQIAGALGYAHRQHVIHRDVKPANILLDDDGNTIVTDFGIAKRPRRSNLTQTGMTLGTPSYMSPEQCRSKEVTAASDQYSLGIVGYEMLAGEPPFTGPSLEVMKAHVEQPPSPLAAHRPHCPPELVTAIERMLEKDPPNRWPTLEDFIAAIGGAPLAHDDPVRAQLAALATHGRRPARLRVTGKGGVATASPPRGEPVIVTPPKGTTPPPRSDPQSPPSPPAGQPAVTPPREQRAAVPEEIIPDYLRPETPAPVASLVITPHQASVWVGHTLKLEATPLDAAGQKLGGRGIRWESGDPEIATVTTSGVVTAIGPGRARLRARCEGVADTVLVEALPVRAESVKIRPWRRVLAQGETLQFRAVVRGSDGSRLTDRPITWECSNPAVIDITSEGQATAYATGQAEVSARCEGQAATVGLRVTEPGPPYWLARFWWAAPAAAVAILLLWLLLRSGPTDLPVVDDGPDPATTEETTLPEPGGSEPTIDSETYVELARGSREEARLARDAAITAGADQLYASEFRSFDSGRSQAETAWIQADYEAAIQLFSDLAAGYRSLEERARARDRSLRSAASAARSRAQESQRSAQNARATEFFPSDMGQAARRMQAAEGHYQNGRWDDAERAFAALDSEYRSLARRASVRSARAAAESSGRRAEGERLRVLAAGGRELAAARLAALDRSYRSARSQLENGQYRAATDGFDGVAVAYGRLADELEALPEPEPEPPPPTAEETLSAMVERFGELFEQENLAAIGAELYRGEVPDDEREEIYDPIFRAARNIDATTFIDRLEVRGATATADIRFEVTFTRQPDSRRVQWEPKFRLRFARDDDGWRIVQFSQR